jgi:hypothetical protein
VSTLIWPPDYPEFWQAPNVWSRRGLGTFASARNASRRTLRLPPLLLAAGFITTHACPQETHRILRAALPAAFRTGSECWSFSPRRHAAHAGKPVVAAYGIVPVAGRLYAGGQCSLRRHGQLCRMVAAVDTGGLGERTSRAPGSPVSRPCGSIGSVGACGLLSPGPGTAVTAPRTSTVRLVPE